MRMFPCGITSSNAEDPGEVCEPRALDVSVAAWASSLKFVHKTAKVKVSLDDRIIRDWNASARMGGCRVQPIDLSEISRAIQVRHIAVPIGEAATVAENERGGPVSRRLIAAEFACAPVMRGQRPVGIVAASSCRSRASIASVMRPLDESLLISADTSLSELPPILAEEPFLFVLHGRRIVGFVTPSDMGSVPARTHFYLQLSQLEIALARLVRRDFPDQEVALAELSDGRQVTTRELMANLHERDEFLDVVAALGLVDLIVIAGKLPGFRETAREAAGGQTWRSITSRLGEFRNDVMHPVRDFARATQEGMRYLAAFDLRVRSLLSAAYTLLEARNTGDPD